MSSNETSYAITVLDTDGSVLVESNGLALFETMSSIKSPIGTLAINKACELKGSIDDEDDLMVTTTHNSNGSGKLKDSLPSAFPITLRNALYHNIIESDCVATNVLIDYLGGKDTVNDKIRREMGIVGIELVTERINFEGVNHREVPFQVGRGTTRDFAKYYQQIWSDSSELIDEHRWHRNLHKLVNTARLFGVGQRELARSVSWIHKTGSGEDVNDSNLYSTMMDAGELQINNRTLYVAAALTVNHSDGPMPSRADILADFAERNTKAIADIPSRPAA
ncbi:MAG TPA: serine hydrolase [Candidatus Saccharimonadales bacterium]